ncbi:endonuclease [Bacteroides sp. 519]|nr:endonuclease [Bacteroides sp. 519]
MSYNIRIGIGMDDSISLQRTADVINKIKPDYVGLQEVDSVAERSGWVDQVRELAKLTGLKPVFASATPRSKGLYGIAALVKEAPLSYKNIALPGIEEPRTFLLMEYNDYILCNTHFSLRAPSRVESIQIIHAAVKEYNKPTLITGDFNMLPQSDEFKLMNAEWALLSDTTIKTHPSVDPKWTLDYIFIKNSDKFEVLNKVVVTERMASDHLPIYVDIKFK